MRTMIDLPSDKQSDVVRICAFLPVKASCYRIHMLDITQKQIGNLATPYRGLEHNRTYPGGMNIPSDSR